jgi:hypothetical protein
MTDFRLGDEVKVLVTGKYREDRFGPHIIRNDSGGLFHIADLADVELVEPADDPSKDEHGSVRRGDHKGVMYVVALSDQGVWKALIVGDQGFRIGFDHHEVAGWEKLEPVDGTPAAVSLPKIRYFQERDYIHTCWRVLSDGAVEYCFGDKGWTPSRRFGSLDQLLEDDEMVEVPEP